MDTCGVLFRPQHVSLDLAHGEQGSSDYSEYGYEPEYEMQAENPPEDEEMLAQWRLER